MGRPSQQFPRHGRSARGWVGVFMLGLCLLVLRLPLAEAQPLHALCDMISLSVQQTESPALPDLCFVRDDDHVLTPQDVLSGRWPMQKRAADQLAFAQTQAAYWVYIPVHNADAQDRTWFLQLNYPLLDQVDFWVFDLGADDLQAAPKLLDFVRMGDAVRFDARPVKHRLFFLPLHLDPGQSLGIVLQVQSNGALNLPLSLTTARAALETTQTHSLGQGMFMGAMLLLAVFNLVLFVRLRIWQPFFNALYVLCAGLFITSMSGLTFQYLWPDFPWLANLSIPLTEVLAILSLLLFTRHFLDVNRQAWPRQAQAIRGLFYLGLVLLLACFWLPYALITKINTVFALSSMVLMFGISIRHALHGERMARLYLFSWLLFFAGFLLYGLAAFGLIPGFLAQERWMQIALGSQIFLLTYAEVMQLRELMDRALQIESAARSSLQQQVQLRTADLETTMGALEQANQQLLALSQRDALTGLLNRRGLDESLAQLLRQSERSADFRLVLVIFDLDHFKRVNDIHGHDAGDVALQWVAEVLRNLLRRQADVLGRFGGEEFVVLMPGTALDGAIALVDRLLDHIRRHQVTLPDGSQLQITLSAGLAAWQAGDTAQVLFRRADTYLYQAKARGRDCQVSAASSG
ncbi:diguanylate cyclase [Castellaniella sp.]|uniref:sensor domain-containing diguanylate cyclase n=1 Tax=Castellaniella sp. TaxID=1955812 RepID=UPI002AFF2903|nr:diguanylate cyclase [Castellaniella sp.]